MGAILHSDRFVRPAIRRIGSEDEAFEAADSLSQRLGADTSQSYRLAIARSGLLALSIPDEFGGADITNAALADVVRRLTVNAPQAALCLARHFVASEIVRNASGPVQLLFAQMIDGAMLDAIFEGVDGLPRPDPAFGTTDRDQEPASWTVILRRAATGAATVRLRRGTAQVILTAKEETEWLEGAALRLDETALPMVSAVSCMLGAGLFLGRLEQAVMETEDPLSGSPSRTVIARETVTALAERLGSAIDRAQVLPGAANIAEVAKVAAVLAHMRATFAEATR